MSTYIKSFSNAADMRAYLDTAAGMKYYLFKNESGTAGVGATPESGKSIVSLFKGRDYLTFTAQQSNSTVSYTKRASETAEYSLDGGNTWTNGIGATVTLANVGDKVIYRGVYSGTSTTSQGRFSMTGKIAASGSVMSMYNNNPNDVTLTLEQAFKALFANCTSLTTAPELPATTLSKNCYNYMFTGCTSLTTAPELPATTLTQGCYNTMFNGCSSLTTAPELPATTLANGCYSTMFKGCSSLTTPPELPATTLVQQAYNNMFQNCTSLVIAPVILATAGSSQLQCLNGMFDGCSSLNYVKIYITDWQTSRASNWLQNVAASGTVECPTASTIPSDSTAGIPTGWTRVNF